MKKKIIWIALFMFSINVGYSSQFYVNNPLEGFSLSIQFPDDDDEPPTEDPLPPAPIDNYIYLFSISMLGVAVGYFALNKTQKSV